MGQELDRFEQEDSEAMGSFNELLKKVTLMGQAISSQVM